MLTARPSPWRRLDPRLIAVAAAGFSAFLNLYAPQSLLPTLVKEFQARHETVGLTVSAATLAIALASPLAGVVASRYPRRVVLRACFAGLFVTTLGAALSPTLWALIAWRFVQGLFIPPILALTMAYVGEAWEAHEVGHVMSIYVACNVVGGFSGRFLAGITTAHAGWRTAFLVLALLNAVSAWAVLRAMPDRPRGAETPFDLRVLAGHLRDPQLMRACATGFSVLFALVGLFTYVTFYLADAPFDLGPDALGALFTVYLVGVFVTPLGGRLIHPLGHRAVIMGCTAISMVGAAITLIPSVPAVLVGLTICSSCVFINQSAATGYVSDVSGSHRASALGIYLCLYYLGGSAGAAVPGLLWARAGWPGTIGLLVLVNVVTIILASGLRPRPAAAPVAWDPAAAGEQALAEA